MRRLSIAAVLSLLGASCAPTSLARPAILYDYGRELEAPSGLSAAQETALLASLFPTALRSASACHPRAEGTTPDELRASGQFAPTLAGVARGAFTRAGVVETAYLVRRNECELFGFEQPGSSQLVILAHGVPVARAELEDTMIDATSDLDGDGKNELLVSSSNMHTGLIVSRAELVRLDDGKLVQVREFGRVLEDACPGALANPTRTAALLTYEPADDGSFPALVVTQQTAGCTP